MRAGIAAQHDHAIGQQHGFLDVVGHNEDRLRRHLLVGPQLQQFAAQVLRREHVERGERFVHEQHLRLDHQRARETHALLHAAGKLFGIRRLEAVEAHGVDHLQRALVALNRADAARHQRRFHVLQHGEPGKQREALEDDGDVGNLPVHRFAVPEHVARGRLGQAGQHAQQGGFSRARRAQQGDNLARTHLQIGRRNDFNAIAVRLRIILLDCAGLNDRLAQGALL